MGLEFRQDTGISVETEEESVRSFAIAGREIGEGLPCFVIAEMGLAHDGSLGAAHAFIDAASAAGADAVKFQTHDPDAESTPQENFRVNVFPQDATRRDYWRRTMFTEKQWRGLKEHADNKGIIFLSTPFSLPSLDLLLRIGIPAWKVGSGETNNLVLIEAMAKSGLPVLVSTGMSYLQEIDCVARLLGEKGAPFALLQCTTRYPCPPEELGLNLIAEWRRRYNVPVGLSDHSGTIYGSLAAVALGACVVETHVTFSRACFGPDVPASITFEELRFLVQGAKFIWRSLASPLDKDVETRGLEDMRRLFTKSVVAKRKMAAGMVLSMADLDTRKPGTGIPAAMINMLPGRRLSRDVSPDKPLTWDDIENA